MTDNRLYLHIGFGKCGSSALQHFLSASPLIRSAGKVYEYAALTERGRLVRRAELKALADASLVGYMNSSPRVASFAKGRRAVTAINRLLDKNINLILSHEYWAYQRKDFHRSGLIASLNRPVIVIAYVRPQVDWLNSAWWQWFYWEHEYSSIRHFLEAKGVHGMDWSRILGKWADFPNVEAVVPRLLTTDIVSDFSALLNFPAARQMKSTRTTNATLTLPMVAMLSRITGLRGQNESYIDFILEKRAPLAGRKPWAIAFEEASQILESLRPSNERLAQMLDPDSERAMRADSRWWSPDLYRDRAVDEPRDYTPTEAEREQFVGGLMRGLVGAERELFQMRRERILAKENTTTTRSK